MLPVQTGSPEGTVLDRADYDDTNCRTPWEVAFDELQAVRATILRRPRYSGIDSTRRPGGRRQPARR